MRLLILDDDAPLVHGLARVLCTREDIEAIDKALTVEDALVEFQRTRVLVLTCDVNGDLACTPSPTRAVPAWPRSRASAGPRPPSLRSKLAGCLPQ